MFRFVLFCQICCALLLPHANLGVAHAASVQIALAPTRVILDDKDRSKDIQVISLTNVPLYYDINTSHYLQGNDGSMHAAAQMTKRQMLAEKMLRFSPRHARLEAKGSQLIRLVYRAPRGVPDGEYRLHMAVHPSPAAPQTDNKQMSGGESPDIALDIYIGVAIPVFVRVGETHVKVDITNVAFSTAKRDPTKPALDVTFSRDGNRSAFGDVSILYTPKGGGEARRIGLARGIPIYLPNRTLTSNIPLDLNPGETLRSLAGGTLRVVYVDAENDQAEELASSVFNL